MWGFYHRRYKISCNFKHQSLSKSTFYYSIMGNIILKSLKFQMRKLCTLKHCVWSSLNIDLKKFSTKCKLISKVWAVWMPKGKLRKDILKCLPVCFCFSKKALKALNFFLVLLFLIWYSRIKKEVLKCFLKPFSCN